MSEYSLKYYQSDKIIRSGYSFTYNNTQFPIDPKLVEAVDNVSLNYEYQMSVNFEKFTIKLKEKEHNKEAIIEIVQNEISKE